jgi:hypothetical protein
MRYAIYILLFCKCFGALGQASTTVNVSIAVPSVALIDILPTGSTGVTLTMTAPTESGNAVNTGSSNNANWLIFTSAVASGASRSIKGDLVGTLPAGVLLKLEVSPYAGSGLGFTGGNSAVTSNTYLTNTPTKFIDNIKGAYTGTGYGTSGFKLKYTLEIQTYANVKSGTSNVTVRYTMVDN